MPSEESRLGVREWIESAIALRFASVNALARQQRHVTGMHQHHGIMLQLDGNAGKKFLRCFVSCV